jgi:hypothetical protein
MKPRIDKMKQRSIHIHIRRLIGGCNNPPGFRFIENEIKFNAEDIRIALNELIDSGDVEMVEVDNNYKYKLTGV